MAAPYDKKYDPEGTETFNFFGNPIVEERLSPIKCFFHDCANILVHFPLVIAILSFFQTERTIDELYLWAPTVFSLMWFTWWSLVQTPFVLTFLATLLSTGAVLSALIEVHHFLFWSVINGPPLQVYPPSPPDGYDPGQRWIYFNGVATGKVITRQNIQCLAETFNNPILAVNNRTYGFFGDLLECIIQRAFAFRTKETGIGYNIIRNYLEDDKIRSVVIVAHSQGGILAAQILDDLYCSVSHAALAKLEVYTFGSAALTFNNPIKDKMSNTRVVPVVEHYCNARDMVTSWGALASADRSEIPFMGNIFVFQGQTGHMLNQHYLKHMFTGPERTWKKDDFQFRAVRRDAKVQNKFHVGNTQANTLKGEESVQSLTKLWTYM